MKILYAPWRSDYTLSADQTKHEHASDTDCVFCIQLQKQDDKQYFILKRLEHSAVLLNTYPYNAGHLLIVPLAHQANLSDLTPQARAEIIEASNMSVSIIKKILQPHGFNIGLNVGIAAGASIPSHLHMHVLPRWTGDTNFLPTLSDTKVISFDLSKIYDQLQPSFALLNEGFCP